MIKKYPDFLMILLLSVITFLTRIINILKIPIFTDEAIYVRWAQIGLADPVHRYISLTDGKQPLLTWLMYPFLNLFSDPLFAGRFISVLSGIFNLIGIYLLSKFLFNRGTAILSSILYIISPFFLVYDRLALMDSLLASFAVWSIYLQVLQSKYLRLDISMLLGLTIGLGLLTKSSAMFFIYLIPTSLLLFNFANKNKYEKLIKLVLYSFLSTAIGLLIYNSLRLSPAFYIIEQKNYSFIYTFSELLSAPFKFFWPNLYGLLDFLFNYLTLPVIIIVFLSLTLALIRKNLKILYLFLWFIVPFSALALFGKVLFPRFILFMSLPLLIIAANMLSELFSFLYSKKKLFVILAGISLYMPLYISFVLITDPVNAKIPENDRNQLFNDWPSGYGVREVISYLRDEAKKGKIVIGTEGTFGLNPAVYEIYLKNNPNVYKIIGYWPVSQVPPELLEYSKMYPTYLIFKEKQKIPGDWPLQLIAKYKRGNSETFLYFFKVLPVNV